MVRHQEVMLELPIDEQKIGNGLNNSRLERIHMSQKTLSFLDNLNMESFVRSSFTKIKVQTDAQTS